MVYFLPSCPWGGDAVAILLPCLILLNSSIYASLVFWETEEGNTCAAVCTPPCVASWKDGHALLRFQHSSRINTNANLTLIQFTTPVTNHGEESLLLDIYTLLAYKR